MYIEKIQKIFDSEIPESNKGNEIIKIYSGMIKDISTMPFDDKKSFLSWIHSNVSGELAERLQEIFFQSNLVNDDQLMQILGLLTGSGMQTMLMVAIQVESIKAMTKHREKLLNSFDAHLTKSKNDFTFDISLATKSLSADVEKKTKEIFENTVNVNSEKLKSDFEQKIKDFDDKVDRQITRMNQSILNEKTTIVQEFNNLKTDFKDQKDLINSELFKQRDETIKAMDSSATEFHNYLVRAFEQFYEKQKEIQKKLDEQVKAMETRALNKVAENLNEITNKTFTKLATNIKYWAYLGAPVLISLFTTGLAIKLHLFS
ncbi:hypothetical protein [Klebsiella quasipneumoniae]|uniref:hypothetical protein n=1 Tax=Klebsiella quasipneumoniae TaxID=1463165 RepID=UPI0021DA8DE8|nr:hypothetical protein [Klebsiella quasipneumoniae]MCU8819992.1 hypothetical protein [Klebsiella quasipneumoniae]